MAVDSSNAVSQSQIISSTSKTTNTKKSNTLNMENFLSLLVAEMQNQEPLEPTSNSDYMAQMATFSQVEATTEMNEKVLSQTASNLIGKAVIVKTDMNTSGYADWCGPCKRLAPLLENLKEIDVLKVNVDLFDSLSRSYGIMSIPTLILFENGKEIKKIIGFHTETEIKEFIK